MLIATTVPTAANPGYNDTVTVWRYIEGGRKSLQWNLFKLVNVTKSDIKEHLMQ